VGLFEQLDVAAYQVMVQAQQEARGLAHEHASSEHLLLGLLAVREEVAGRALESLGLSLVLVRGRVVQRVGVGDRDSPEAVPFTPCAKRIITSATDEALARGGDHVGTEDILLAVLREDEAVAVAILRDLGIDLRQLARKVSASGSTQDQAAGPG
jgi:ATP-dependent Clp protease ATP-binding subunit ClpC